MTEHVAGTRGLELALASYSILVMLQLATYVFTNILVLLAQGLEMLSDVLISGFLLLSASWSRKAADEIHMFGHGRAQYFVRHGKQKVVFLPDVVWIQPH